jgi:hypothetical protein
MAIHLYFENVGFRAIVKDIRSKQCASFEIGKRDWRMDTELP